MRQMSVGRDQTKRNGAPLVHSGCKNFFLALELLRGYGMILRAKLLRPSPADGRCHPAERDSKGPLSSRVHSSSVICCNGLNLSRGSCV